MYLLNFLQLFAVLTVCNGQIVTVTMNETSYAERGSNATIMCNYALTDSSYTWFSIQWRKGAVGGTYDTATTVATNLNNNLSPIYPIGGSKYSMSTDSIANSSVLTVSLVQLPSDEGMYWCRAEFTKVGFINPDDAESTELTITESVDSTTSSSFMYRKTSYNANSTIEVIAEGDQVFDFTLFDIKPNATFKWYLNEDLEQEDGVSRDSGEGVLVDSPSTFTVVLQVSPPTQTLRVTATNNQVNPTLFDLNFIVYLQIKGIPDKVTNLNSTGQTESSLSVRWTPGYDGGEDQHYRVGYLKKSPPGNENLIENNITDTKYTVSDLDAETEYEIRVYAENVLGRNEDYASINASTSPEPTTEPPTSEQTTTDKSESTTASNNESTPQSATIDTTEESPDIDTDTTTQSDQPLETVSIPFEGLDSGLSVGAKIAIGVVCGIAGIAAIGGGVAVALHFHAKNPPKVQPSTIATGDNDKATVVAQPSTNGTGDKEKTGSKPKGGEKI